MADQKRRLSGYTFAPGLAAIRTICGGNKAHEASLSGVSRLTWHRWERCSSRAPAAALEAIAKRWRVDVGVLKVDPTAGILDGIRLEQALLALADEHGGAAVRRAALSLLS